MASKACDFTYIDNAVSANLLACHTPASQVAGHVFNVASGTRFSLNETFRILSNIIGYEKEAIYDEPRAGDVKHSLADIATSRKALEYYPTVGFEEGLRRTVKWYRKSLAAV